MGGSEGVPTEVAIAAEANDGAALSALAVSVRRHRIWLIILTSVLALMTAGIVAMVMLAVGIGSFASESLGVSEESVAKAKQEVEGAYGDRLKKIDVRSVEVDYGGTAFPFSLMSGGSMKSLYVEYSLKDSDVVFADLLSSGMFGEGVASSGMLPTKGSLVSRMSPEKFDRLLAAYSAETKTPLGAIRRYGDDSYFSETGSKVPDELTVGDRTLPTKELWSAVEGRIIKGDSVDMSDDADYSRNALIFWEDPATGEFAFLGTEPSNSMW